MVLRSVIFFAFLFSRSGLISISAQNLSVGLAAGGAPTNAFETEKSGVPGTFDTYSQFKDYLIGVTLEYRLPWNLSIEGDALRRELDLTQAFVESNLAFNDIQHLAVVTWELPVLAKYRFHWSKGEPFIEAGPSYRTTGNRSANPSHYGVSAGVGVAMHWKAFEIAPVVRYTHWAHDQAVFADASKPDQLELLVGFSRRTPSDLHALGPRVSFGVIAGATLLHDVPQNSSPFTIFYQNGPAISQESGTGYLSGLDSFLAGPSLEVALPKSLYVEFDAMYHPIRSSSRSVLSDGTILRSFSGTQARTWEFPLLAKYKFGDQRLKPFAEAGPSFRTAFEGSSEIGICAGAGVEVRVRSFKIAPAIRYTRWKQQASPDPSEIRLNQIVFVTGFSL